MNQNASVAVSRTPGGPAALPVGLGPRAGVEHETDPVHAFVEWMNHHYRDGGISMPSQHLLEVQPRLSREFCIGLHDMRYYIGVPTSTGRWFFGLPWACAAVSGSSLLLVCRAAQGQGLAIPAFCLSFEVNPANYTRGLSHYHFLDVRTVELDRQRPGAFHISRRVASTLPVRIATPATGDVLALLTGAE